MIIKWNETENGTKLYSCAAASHKHPSVTSVTWRTRNRNITTESLTGDYFNYEIDIQRNDDTVQCILNLFNGNRIESLIYSHAQPKRTSTKNEEAAITTTESTRVQIFTFLNSLKEEYYYTTLSICAIVGVFVFIIVKSVNDG